MQPLCPTCGGALKKVPERKTKCPHCGDHLFVKHGPDEPRDARRVVGSAKAAEIEKLWEAQHAARFASYVRDREAAIERLRTQRLPAGVVACFVRFAGPVRHGDCFEVIWCNDRAKEFRIVDLNTWTLFRTDAPGLMAPLQVLPLTLVCGASIDYVDPRTGFVCRGFVRISADHEAAWSIEALDDSQAIAIGNDYWQACG